MKVSVNYDLCEANAICVGMAPDVFEITDDDTMVIKKADVPAEREEEMRQIIASCPRSALSLGD